MPTHADGAVRMLGVGARKEERSGAGVVEAQHGGEQAGQGGLQLTPAEPRSRLPRLHIARPGRHCPPRAARTTLACQPPPSARSHGGRSGGGGQGAIAAAWGDRGLPGSRAGGRALPMSPDLAGSGPGAPAAAPWPPAGRPARRCGRLQAGPHPPPPACRHPPPAGPGAASHACAVASPIHTPGLHRPLLPDL